MIPRGITHTIRNKLNTDLTEFGEYRIVTTVRHTGSHSIIEQFPGYTHWHCNPQVWGLIEQNLDKINVITTYRDPLRTAASWLNRGQLPFKAGSPHRDGCIFSWKEAWFYYGKIIKTNPDIYRMEDLDHKLYTHDDSSGAHSLLDNGDIEGYYKLVNKDLIDYALHSIGASYVEN